MAEEVSEVPPEVKLEMVPDMVWSMIVAMWAIDVDSFAGVSFGVPLEKWFAAVKPVAGALIGQGTKTVIENFKIPGNDCTTAAKAHNIMVDVLGFKPKVIEMTPEKAVVHETECPMVEACKSIFPKYLDFPVEKMVCTANDEAMGKAVNPKITFRHGETICKGGKVCEHIWELKE